tara:strand:+ start:2919 stop:3731 length:813 start_codon:yes stop_codon:yes gene_type:complete
MSDTSASDRVILELVTRCPTCETAFRVTPEQLETANGMVRCGKCIGVFNAPEHQVITATEPSAEINSRLPDLLSDQSLDVEGKTPLPRLTALIHNEFSEPQTIRKPSNTLRTVISRLAVVAVGALVLAGQYIYFFSADLSRNENYRQPLITSCYYLGCKVAPYSDLDQLTINTFIIQSHPTQTGAVIVDMLIENKAPFRQPYPRIKVRFDDLQGQLVAQRIFSAEEYISQQNPRRQPAVKNISSGRQSHVSFSLVDPGLSAVNYLVELTK